MQDTVGTLLGNDECAIGQIDQTLWPGHAAEQERHRTIGVDAADRASVEVTEHQASLRIEYQIVRSPPSSY